RPQAAGAVGAGTGGGGGKKGGHGRGGGGGGGPGRWKGVCGGPGGGRRGPRTASGRPPGVGPPTRSSLAWAPSFTQPARPQQWCRFSKWVIRFAASSFVCSFRKVARIDLGRRITYRAEPRRRAESPVFGQI